MRPQTILAILILSLAAGGASACTISFACDGKLALAGNNEDWKDSNPLVWFSPGADGEHGRIVFGFANGWPQGGVNEKGLFFDAAASAPLAQERNRDRPHGPYDILDRMLRTCATVEEAVGLLDKYRLPFMDRAMLLLADRTGRSAIYEGDLVRYKDGPYQVLTNFYQSQQTAEQAHCWRFPRADRILADHFKTQKPLTVKLMREVLDAVHQEGQFGTKYSNIYDLTNGRIHLYQNHDFDRVVVLDVAGELAKGKSRVSVASLFEDLTESPPAAPDRSAP